MQPLFYFISKGSVIGWDYAATSPRLPANADGGKIMVITRTELSRLQHTLADGVKDIEIGPSPRSPRSPRWEESYDLTGRRIPASSLPRGVYIKNGRKVLVR